MADGGSQLRRTHDFSIRSWHERSLCFFTSGELLERVNVSVFAVSSPIRRRSGTVLVQGDVSVRVMAIVVMMAIDVMVMLAARKLDVGVTMRPYDFPDTVPGAALMSMGRRRRYDAKLHQSDCQQPSQEATKHDHGISLNASFLPLLEAEHREYGLASRDATRFPQHASPHQAATFDD